jgi:hypothetical protein
MTRSAPRRKVFCNPSASGLPAAPRSLEFEYCACETELKAVDQPGPADEA